MSSQAYFITEQGTWPAETYKINLSGQIINPDLFTVPAENSFRFINNPTVPVNFYSKYYYSNATPTFDDEGSLYEIDTTSKTLLEWRVSQERTTYNVGDTFNSFSIDSKPGIKADDKYYSYILYPKRLFLKPVSVFFENGTCTLNTETVLLENYSAFNSSSSSDLEIAYRSLEYLNSTRNTIPIPSTNAYSIIYSLSACRTRAEVPVITFTNAANGPSYFSIVLEPVSTLTVPVTSKYKSVIRRNSTYVSYLTDFHGINDDGSATLVRLGQQRPDMISTSLPPTIKSSYIITQNTPTNKQAFQLVQLKADTDDVSSINSRYCILSAVFDLSNSNFSYFNKSYTRADSSLVTLTTGVPDSYIGVSYIADCPLLQFTGQTWEETINSFYDPSYAVSVELGVPINNDSLPASLDWNSDYPPHYYSYKAYLKNNSTNALLESADLTFYLYTSAVSSTKTSQGYTNSVTLSTFIASDFGFLSYGLKAWGEDSYSDNKDFVKFNINIETTTPNLIASSNTVILSSLTAYYGDSFDKQYSLLSNPWIPAYEAGNLMIMYPSPIHGEINFTLRPTLCSFAGYMDAYQATKIKLAENQPPLNLGQPIFTTKVLEIQDYMEVDSSFLISDSSWPTRDLRNSYVSWSFTPTSSFVKINAVDTEGNYIKDISPSTAVLFDYKSWTVAISGYGPQTTVLNLSSQKYNEITSVTSNSSLFDYFAEGRLLVGTPYGLNNLNEIRTVYLTAVVPYKGRRYNLPPQSQLSWTWTYNNEIDFDFMPVSGFFLPTLSSYPYGYDLNAYQISSINIFVKPPYKNTIPELNEVVVTASVDSEKGLITGEYRFQVDDFPDRSIFNTDFNVLYRSYANSLSSSILDTTSKNYTITRPDNGTNYYTLCANDVVDTYSNNTLVWNISGTSGINSKKTNQKSVIFSRYEPSKTLVTLSSINTIVPGWTSAHNLQTTVTFYILDNDEFINNLSFLAIPEFFWADGRFLTLSDTSNYTLIPLNTAFENKQSNSQRYYLSSNKSFLNDYRYSSESSYINVSSYYELVDIPYGNSMFTEKGMTVSVTGFNDTTFPESAGLFYKMPAYGSLTTFAFPIRATTKSISGVNSHPLSKNLKLIPYNTITASFTSTITSVNLDTNRLISITQSISTSPLESPVQPVGGTITYTLSSLFWSANKDVPAVDGYYDLFEISIGDASELLKVNGTKETTLLLSASANILKTIPASTFDNYAENQYTGPRDIWNTVYESIPSLSGQTTLLASSTAGNPEIFLSSTYTLTGSDFFVQYYTPKNTSEYYVVAYMTDFGEPDSYRITGVDSTLFYQYRNSGTYFISYSALYNDGSIKFYEHPNPVIVKSAWEAYDPNSIRFVEERILEFPYNESEVNIQPNEWGDSDIFNTAISRLQDNLDYLASNLQTLDTSSPTVVFGWLGSNTLNYEDGIRWYTKDFGSLYYTNPSLAVSNGTSYFTNIKDAFETSDHFFVLEGTNLRCLSADNFATKMNLVGSSDLKNTFLNPMSIELDESGKIAYVADPPKNKVYRLDLDFENTPTVNYSLNVGGLGTIDDTNKFNSPSELVYSGQSLYVLDYNNNCVKQYSKDLNWIYTYNVEEFFSDIPESIAVHPKFNLLYVLTKSKLIYIFENFSENYFSKIELPEVESEIVKIVFDEAGEFIYVVSKNNVYKYSSSGYFITELDLPSGINYVSAKSSKNRSLILIGEKCIIKIQDVLDVYKVGEGLPSNYWSKNQLIVDRNEFSSDTNYNRSLKRMAQNIKMLRDTFNYKLVLATEQTPTSVVTYFASVPVKVSERPVFDSLIESEELGVGVNELHVPQVINRELSRLYNAINQLKHYLDIDSYNLQDDVSCKGQFCWSWKAMSCFKLKLPIVRICNINPITYAELEYGFPFSYAPSRQWKNATSECCDKVAPPV